MSQQKRLYVPWSEKEQELEEAPNTQDDPESRHLRKIRGRAWDRAEDQSFIFVMTIALM